MPTETKWHIIASNGATSNRKVFICGEEINAQQCVPSAHPKKVSLAIFATVDTVTHRTTFFGGPENLYNVAKITIGLYVTG